MSYNTDKFSKFASVILDLGIEKAFDYGIPDNLKINKGMHVAVTVRGHKRKGYVFEVKDHTECKKVAEIKEILHEEEILSDELFELAIWMAKYYATPVGKVIKTMLPGSIRNAAKHKEQLFVTKNKTLDELCDICRNLRSKYPSRAKILDVILKVKKGILLTELLEKAETSRSPLHSLVKENILRVESIQIDRSPLADQEFFRTKPKKLNEHQAVSLAKIVSNLDEQKFKTELLYGVTGSGKTEVYLQAIDHALKLGKSTIMLVPEISLTQQTVERFRSRFDKKIAILHHRLSPGERFDEWHRARRGEAQIVIGARSAIFTPVKNLGLIIVDEEHERSYKQTDDRPSYHARDIATVRGKISGSTVILGSATPSLESYSNALKGKYSLSSLPKRASTSVMPSVTVVDMTKEYEKNQGYTTFSDALLTGIKRRFAEGEQTILFLNRRGYHTTQVCPSCGYVAKCPHCDISLTFHKGDNVLACHLCDFVVNPPPRTCESCSSNEIMKYRGVGTEQVERALHAIFPEIRTCRIDADTTKHKGSYEKLLKSFRSGKADVLIGTQMIGKGLHFPQVTLVGVLNSDSSLQIPDFRSSEYTFQIITQVAGRSGRGLIPGEVIIQTRMPENNTIIMATKLDFEAFYQNEIGVRQMFGYPPFSRMVKIVFLGAEENKTSYFANSFRASLMQNLSSQFKTSSVVPSGYAKIKNQYRFQFLVRGPDIYHLNKIIAAAKKSHPQSKKINYFVDIDPVSTFH